MQPDTPLGRRDVLAMAGTSTVALGGIGGATLAFPAGATARAQIDTQDLAVTTPDGTVDEIVVYMQVECTYENVDGTVQWMDVTTTLNGETIHSDRYDINHPDWLEADVGEDSGSVVYRPYMDRFGSNDRVFLFEDTAYESADFAVDEDGTTETFDLDLGVDVGVVTQAEETVATTETSATTQLSITNEADGDSDGDENGTGPGNGTDGGQEPTASASVDQVRLFVELPNGERVSSN